MPKIIKNILHAIGAVISVITAVFFILSRRKTDDERSGESFERDNRIKENLGESQRGVETIESTLARSAVRINDIADGMSNIDEELTECAKRLSRGEETLRSAILAAKKEDWLF